jgi:L-2-hydroxyglutarate oxidase LhgO
MDKYYFDCTIISGGVSGLSCVRAIARKGLSVALIEKVPNLACHTSARNSEVLHSGIYYSKSPLKLESCIEGQQMLYEHLQQRQIEYFRISK